MGGSGEAGSGLGGGFEQLHPPVTLGLIHPTATVHPAALTSLCHGLVPYAGGIYCVLKKTVFGYSWDVVTFFPV